MRRKNQGYLVTYEDGSQRTFKTIGEMELVFELTHLEIVKHLKSGEPTYDNTTRKKIWIEELA